MNQGLAETATCSFSHNIESPFVKELKVLMRDLLEKEEDGRASYTGGAEGMALYKDNELAVQLLTLNKGESFPEHFHPVEKEWIILVNGSGTVWLNGKEIKMKSRDSIIIEPNNNHCGVVDETSLVLCVSIPADEAYPNVAN